MMDVIESYHINSSKDWIDTTNGNVVYGLEPEYEESTIVADDFSVFISKIISGDIVL